jgi:high-affinity iron transporter
VTSWLIALLAAGMAAQSVSFLEKGGVVELLSANVWDTSGILSEQSIAGRILHTLVGYSDQPSELQLMTYVVTLGVMLVAPVYLTRTKKLSTA